MGGGRAGEAASRAAARRSRTLARRLAAGQRARTPTYDTYTFVVRDDRPSDHAPCGSRRWPHPSLVKGGPGRAANGNFALSDFTVTAAPLAGGKATPVKLVEAAGDLRAAGLPVAAAIDADPRSAWAVDPQFGKDHAAVFELAEPRRLRRRDRR